MREEFKDFQETPTLTFHPFEEEKAPVPAAAPEKPAEVPVYEESILSEEEKKMVEDFSKQIDLHNSGMILQYGAGAQKKMADFSESALENVRTKDLGEVGTCLQMWLQSLKALTLWKKRKVFLAFLRKEQINWAL